MKAFEKRAHAMCCKFVLKNIQLILSKHFEAPVLFWDEQSGIFGKASESSLRRSRTNISRDFVWVTAVQQMLPLQHVAVQSERLVGNLRW